MTFHLGQVLWIFYTFTALPFAGADDDDDDELPYPIDCIKPYVCRHESHPRVHCTAAGRVVFGHCGLQMVLCREWDDYDPGDDCLDD